MPLIKIDAGIGGITVIEPENIKLKMLVDSLKDHIEIYGVDKLTEFFLDDKDMGELKSTILDLENTIEEKDGEIADLESELESEEDSMTTIECGIGTINYETDNVLLEMVMENLDAAIQKHNPLRVNEKLELMC